MMNAKQFVNMMTEMAAKDDAFSMDAHPRFSNSTNPMWTGGSVGSSSIGSAGSSINGNTTGINPFTVGGTYIGDPPWIDNTYPSLPNYPFPVNVPMPSPPSIVTVTGGSTTGFFNDLFMEFFNVQRLQVEATCAVTGEKIKVGEPVLILDEHVISKKAFMKMLMKQFARMMTPEIEDIAEIYDYDK